MVIKSKLDAILQSLQSAALLEEWDEVDKLLPLVCDEVLALAWAAKNASNNDPNLRDLAVSIFEQSSHPLDTKNTDTLTALMYADANPYVRFRSAFALFRHGERSDDVIAMIRKATTDQDVAETAHSYLKELAA